MQNKIDTKGIRISVLHILAPALFLVLVPMTSTLLGFFSSHFTKNYFYLSIFLSLIMLLLIVYESRRIYCPYEIILSYKEAFVLAAICLVCSFFILPAFYVGQSIDANNILTGFTTDDPKHYAFIGELSHGLYPPRNPFFANDPLHYYYFYHLLTAVLAVVSGINMFLAKAISHLLIINLFVISFFFFARQFLNTRFSLIATAFISFVGGFDWIGNAVFAQKDGLISNLSKQFFEGGYLNIDNSNWIYSLLDKREIKIDFFYRVFIYVPQHLFAIALSLCVFTMILNFEPLNKKASFLYAGILSILMGGILGSSIFIFLGTAVIVGSYVLYLLARKKWAEAAYTTSIFPLGMIMVFPMVIDTLHATGQHSLIYDPCFAIRSIGLSKFVITQALEYGPFIIFGVLGITGLINKKDISADKDKKKVFLLLLTIAPFFVINLFRLTARNNDFGMRISHFVWIGLSIYSIKFIEQNRMSLMRYAFVFLSLIGIVSVVQDYTIHKEGYRLNKDFIVVYKFLQENTPEDAVMQNSKYNSGSLIPCLFFRAVAVGDDLHSAISSDLNKARAAQKEIELAYTTDDPKIASDILRRFHVDYLLVDYPDIQKYGNAIEKFNRSPYRTIFQKGYIKVIKVPERYDG